MNGDGQRDLYREISNVSDDELLVRMRAQGFWPADRALPVDPPAEAEERARLLAEIADLRRTASAVKNPGKALAQERKRRWEESKKRRAENKQRRAAEALQRRQTWAEYRQANLVHAGCGVSGQLQNATSDVEALTQRGLPVLHTSHDLARTLEIPLSRLRWLTYHRDCATLVHYHRFTLDKKSGGVRCISAPKPALAAAQRWIFDNILRGRPVEPCAHGFIGGRSIVTNAAPHAGKAVVVNMDMQDFFPSITFPRVRGLFRRMGYSGHVATLLALLCTEPPRVAAEVDGKVYHVALGQRVLPQGACTSPAITNLLCRRLDRRLTGLARRHQFAYTRYADDLTFSGDKPAAVGRLLRSVRSILTEEDLREHPRKTRVMRRARRQEVTGLTVNQQPAVSRADRRRLRAMLHNARKTGVAAQNRTEHPNFAAYLRGWVQYVTMVRPESRAQWLAALEGLQ